VTKHVLYKFHVTASSHHWTFLVYLVASKHLFIHLSVCGRKTITDVTLIC